VVALLELVESLFYLWRYTKNEMYREWAWEIFTRIHLHTRSKKYCGYSGVENVNDAIDDIRHINQQPSYLIAETFKYLYLLFSPKELLPLERYVFNTEGHPLRILPIDFIATSSNPLWQRWWSKVKRALDID
jgi:mannosyl-oligosaccharide alpha-1,2-mannosidase